MPLSPGKAPEYITSSEWQPPARVVPSFTGVVVSQGTGCGGDRVKHHHRNVGAIDLGPKEGNECSLWLVRLRGALCHRARCGQTRLPEVGREAGLWHIHVCSTLASFGLHKAQPCRLRFLPGCLLGTGSSFVMDRAGFTGQFLLKSWSSGS